MRVTVREPALLHAIPPRNIAWYLSAHDWTVGKERPERFSLWSHPDYQSQVLLPASQDLGDYALRVNELLETLQDFEGRSQLEIITDLLVPYADVVRVRHATSNEADGSLPLESGVMFVAGAKDLVLSAANAAVSPRHYYSSRLEEAGAYLKGVRLGQTERGSFVLTLISPIFVSGALFGRPEEVQEPFERRVTRTLVQAVAAATTAAEAAEAHQDISPFEKVVSLGVSANLCDSLVTLNEETGATAVDFSVTWAAGRELPRPNVPDRVRVPQRLVPALKEASRVFRGSFQPRFTNLSGAIIDLHSEWMLQKADTAAAGLITVAGTIDGRTRKVRVELPMQDYMRAIDAHRQGKLVRVRGVIRREGNYFALQDPTGFVVDDD